LESCALEHASRLLVLPVRGVTWSDLGSEQRLVGALKEHGHFDRINGLAPETAGLSLASAR
jgi:hypothetical protein